MRILYIIDKPECGGGAHVATRLLIPELRSAGHSLEILCQNPPSEEVRRLYGEIPFHVFPSGYHSVSWFVRGIYRKIFGHIAYPPFLIDPLCQIRRLMSSFDVVCCASEESIFRRTLAEIKGRTRRVQLIHTNYRAWLSRSQAARKMAKIDTIIYPRMDAIGVVGKSGVIDFESIIPGCKGKVFPFHNIIDVTDINFKEKNKIEKINLITLANIEDGCAKDGPRILRLARRIAAEGYMFTWNIYGGNGGRISKIQEKIDAEGFGAFIRLHGYTKEIRTKLSNADAMVLLSHYEGLPNSIYESLSSGTPVFATKVGSVPEQIVDGETGWLVEDDEEAIYKKLVTIVSSQEAVLKCHNNLSTYRYPNEAALAEHLKILKGC